jgi:hypothetical protein
MKINCKAIKIAEGQASKTTEDKLKKKDIKNEENSKNSKEDDEEEVEKPEAAEGS